MTDGLRDLTRRDFLRHGGAAVAGLGLAGAGLWWGRLAAEAAARKGTINFADIGVGEREEQV